MNHRPLLAICVTFLVGVAAGYGVTTATSANAPTSPRRARAAFSAPATPAPLTTSPPPEATPARTPERGNGVIEGVIQDSDGRGVEGVRVAARCPLRQRGRDLHALARGSLDGYLEDAASEYRWIRAVDAEAVSAGDGSYRIEGLTEGLTYDLFLSKSGYAFRPQRGSRRNALRPGESASFLARRVIEIPLRVVGPDGDPATRAMVHYEGAAEGWESWNPTEERLALPAYGNYTLCAQDDFALKSDSRVVNLRRNAETPQIQLVLHELGTLRLVIDDPDGCGSYEIFRCPSPADRTLTEAELEKTGGWRTVRSVVPIFEGLEPGDYVIGVARSGAAICAMETVPVAAGTQQVVLSLPRIERRRSLELSVLDPAGRKVSNLRVNLSANGNGGGVAALETPDGDLLLYPRSSQEARFESALGGSGRVQIFSEEFGELAADVPPGARRLELEYAEPALLTVVLQGRARTRVPLQNLRLTLRPGSGGSAKIDGGSAAFLRQPGTYELELSLSEGFRELGIVHRQVELAAGESEISLAIPPLYSLTVEGDGLRSVEVRGEHGSLSKHSDRGTEKFVFDHLPAGELHLEARTTKGVIDETVTIPRDSDIRIGN